MSEKVVVTSGGIGVFGLLGVILVTLKVLNLIELSWFWVIAPFWMPLAIVLGVIVIVVVALFVFGLIIGLLQRYL